VLPTPEVKANASSKFISLVDRLMLEVDGDELTGVDLADESSIKPELLSELEKPIPFNAVENSAALAASEQKGMEGVILNYGRAKHGRGLGIVGKSRGRGLKVPPVGRLAKNSDDLSGSGSGSLSRSGSKSGNLSRSGSKSPKQEGEKKC